MAASSRDVTSAMSRLNVAGEQPIDPTSVAAAIAMDMSMQEGRKINFADPTKIVPKPKCSACLDLSFRAGGAVAADAAIMHLTNTGSMAAASNAGCVACRVILQVVEMMFRTHGEALESAPKERKTITLESLVEGGSLFVSWNRKSAKGAGAPMHSNFARIEIYTHSCK